MRRPNYIVQPKYAMKRAENDHRQQHILEKWEAQTDGVNTHTNMNMRLRFDKKRKAFYFTEDKFDKRYWEDETLGRVMSSALMLYRLACLQWLPIFDDEPYKGLWKVSLKHVETGKVFEIRDSKAAVAIGMLYTDPEDMPESLRDDILELLDFLVSDDIVHPYDLTVAGSVA